MSNIDTIVELIFAPIYFVGRNIMGIEDFGPLAVFWIYICTYAIIICASGIYFIVLFFASELFYSWNQRLKAKFDSNVSVHQHLENAKTSRNYESIWIWLRRKSQVSSASENRRTGPLYFGRQNGVTVEHLAGRLLWHIGSKVVYLPRWIRSFVNSPLSWYVLLGSIWVGLNLGYGEQSGVTWRDLLSAGILISGGAIAIVGFILNYGASPSSRARIRYELEQLSSAQKVIDEIGQGAREAAPHMRDAAESIEKFARVSMYLLAVDRYQYSVHFGLSENGDFAEYFDVGQRNGMAPHGRVSEVLGDRSLTLVAHLDFVLSSMDQLAMNLPDRAEFPFLYRQAPIRAFGILNDLVSLKRRSDDPDSEQALTNWNILRDIKDGSLSDRLDGLSVAIDGIVDSYESGHFSKEEFISRCNRAVEGYVELHEAYLEAICYLYAKLDDCQESIGAQFSRRGILGSITSRFKS